MCHLFWFSYYEALRLDCFPQSRLWWSTNSDQRLANTFKEAIQNIFVWKMSYKCPTCCVGSLAVFPSVREQNRNLRVLKHLKQIKCRYYVVGLFSSTCLWELKTEPNKVDMTNKNCIAFGKKNWYYNGGNSKSERHSLGVQLVDYRCHQ